MTTVTQTEVATTVTQTEDSHTVEVTELVLPDEPGGPGVSDHGALTGLGDDDHPQYAPKAGPSFTGDVTLTNGSIVVPAVDNEGVTIAGHTNPSLKVREDSPGVHSLVLQLEDGTAALVLDPSNDSAFLFGAAVAIQSTGLLNVFATNGIDFNGSDLLNPSDPSAGNEVGDRDYNDARYQPIDSDLTAIAALSTTAYGRAFLALANQAALMALLSAASTTAAGIAELATDAETITGTDTARTVTPSNLTALFADSTWLEKVSDQVGTMVTGNTETNITVTYQDSDNTLDFAVSTADLTTSGVVELATAAETATGTDATRAVTPDGGADTYDRVYVHNGSSYAIAGGRTFIGGEDPSADGFTPAQGDVWIDPT
jgi:hypothetical protein